MSKRKNECGGCTACCSAMALKEYQKRCFTRCQHQKKGGCARYRRRPKVCQEYHCWWLDQKKAGRYVQINASTRPDILGVIYQLGDTNVGPVLHVWEVKEGGWDDTTRTIANAIAEISNAYIYVIFSREKQKFITPSWKAAHFLRMGGITPKFVGLDDD